MTTTAAEQPTEEKAKGGKKKILVILVLVLALGGGAGWWFFLKPAKGKEKEKPVPGEVIALEAIQINLQNQSYLRVGLGLQAIEGAGAHGPLDGSIALDAAIEIFTGENKEKLAKKAYRHHLKEKLLEELEELYHHEVMDVYFTDFVTQ